MIRENLEKIHRDLETAARRCGRSPREIRLVAVSKRFPASAIDEAHRAGQHLFGENYLQEAVAKKPQLPDSVRFHFIGHLQSNKAKIAAELFDLIETVDRIKIARALNRHLQKLDRRLDILVQVNIGKDPGKSGVDPDQTATLLEQIGPLEMLRPRGLMTITPMTTDPEDARPYFRNLKVLGDRLQAAGLLPAEGLELSMGMSHDFGVAIEEGATLIRIGTAIFGPRPR